MFGAHFPPRLKSWTVSWPTFAIALLVTQAALSLALKPGPDLIAYYEIGYFLLLLMASGVAALTRVARVPARNSAWSCSGDFGGRRDVDRDM